MSTPNPFEDPNFDGSLKQGQGAPNPFADPNFSGRDGALVRGAKTMSKNVGISAGLVSGDTAETAKRVAELDAYSKLNPKSKERQALGDAFEKGDGFFGGLKGAVNQIGENYNKAGSFVGGLRSLGRDAYAIGESVVEQTPNMLLPTAGMIAGGAAGSAAAGPVGTVAGAFAGGAAGNTMVEGGSQVMEALAKANINPSDTAAVKSYLDKNGDKILGQSAVKGSVLGAVDVATAGLGHSILNSPIKAATGRALAEMGVDVADKAAVKAAMNSPAMAQRLGADAVLKQQSTGLRSIGRNAGAAALEPAGEFTGEFVGQGLATGDWDTKNAGLEALSSIGQSGAMYAGQKAVQFATAPKIGIEQQPAATPAQPPVQSGPVVPGAPVAPATPALGQSLTGTPMADLMGGGGLTGGANPMQAGLSTLTSNNQMYPGMNTEPSGYTVDLETGAIIPAEPVGVRQMVAPAAQAEAPAPVSAPAPVAPALGESLTGTPVADMLGGSGMFGPTNPLQSVLDTRTPAQRMGLNPAAGALSAAATVAVNNAGGGLSVVSNLTPVTPIGDKQAIGTQRRIADNAPIDVEERFVPDLELPGQPGATPAAQPAQRQGALSAAAAPDMLPAPKAGLGAVTPPAPQPPQGTPNGTQAAQAQQTAPQRQEAPAGAVSVGGQVEAKPTPTTPPLPNQQAASKTDDKPAREAAGIATATQDTAGKLRFADWADQHSGKSVNEVQTALAQSEFGANLATNEVNIVAESVSRAGGVVAEQARINAKPTRQKSDREKLDDQIKLNRMRVDIAKQAVAEARDVDQFGLPIQNGQKKKSAQARLKKAEEELAALEAKASTNQQASPTPEAGSTNQGAANGQRQETLLNAVPPTGAAAMVSGAPVADSGASKSENTAQDGDRTLTQVIADQDAEIYAANSRHKSVMDQLGRELGELSSKFSKVRNKGQKRDEINDRAKESRLQNEADVRGILDKYRSIIESHPEEIARKAESRRKTQEMKAENLAKIKQASQKKSGKKDKPKTIEEADANIQLNRIASEFVDDMRNEAAQQAKNAKKAGWSSQFTTPSERLAASDIGRYDGEKLSQVVEAGRVTLDRANEMLDSAVSDGWLNKDQADRMKRMIAPAEPAQPPAPTTEPFAHAGLKIRNSRVKVGDDVQNRWVVQSPENAEREARGERQIGGDLIVETRDEAIAKAEQEAKRYVKDKESKAEIAAKEAAEKEAAEAKADAARAAKDRERKDIAAASVAASDTFELGGDAMSNLTGQQDVFGAMEEAAKPAVSANTIFTEDAATRARERLKSKLGRLNSGLDPEMMMDGITLAGYHIEKGARTFAAYAKAMLDDLGDGVKPYLKSWYMGVKYDPRAASFTGMDEATVVESANIDALTAQEETNAPGTNTSVERDSGQSTTEPAVGDTVQNGRGTDATGDNQVPGQSSGSNGRGQPDGSGVQDDGPVTDGVGGNLRLHSGDAKRDASVIATGAEFSERGSGIGNDGISAEPVSASQVDAVAQSSSEKNRLALKQKQADSIGLKYADLDNIKATLPMLLDGQQEDVFKAETRFQKPEGYGMLFTNGTGTGKTFTGLGIVKRMARQGKTNTLVVVPDDKIGDDWIASAKLLGLNVSKLADTKDAGKGIVLTTYANLGSNDALANRAWDLVVADEAHNLMKSADGTVTTYLQNLRAITMHPDGAFQRYAMLNRGKIDRSKALSDEILGLEKMIAADSTTDQQRAEWDAKSEALQKELGALRGELDKALNATRADVKANQGAKRTRLAALSATPFAYEFTIDWANGYLFDYNEGQTSDETESRSYNSGSNRERFFMQHFGYSMRYNKLTKPDPTKVDTGLMQRSFNTMLKKAGSLSGRMLDVKADYDRRFVLVDSAIGNQIDEALNWISDMANEGGAGYSTLRDVIGKKFDYLSRRYLLEAIKAKEAVPIVRKHMEMGRKVVVFHDYKKGGGFNPFNVSMGDAAGLDTATDDIKALASAIDAFKKKFSALVNTPFQSLLSPIEVFSNEFPGVLLINGDEKKADLLARYKAFQDDATGPQVALVQSAKNAGWSGHDTTGKHQRVLINLGQPTAPTLAIQQEGRIYRTGQVSNAIMRYMNTGTNWEKWAFATTIAGRASAAENLGMGELSRALKDSFIGAFEESDAYPPGHEGEGTGGKERDAAQNNQLTAWDRAKSLYWATQKKNSRTKAQEGVDYFATPEPIGMKMAEWLGSRGGERTLEPSAGHGAIARWLPETTKRTVIEPSNTLRSRLALVMNPSDDRILDVKFESLDAVNKFDGIAMNPPFGVGGKTAIEHLAKAATHLADGGRIVALIPTGPAADKRFDQWMYGESVRPEKPLGTIVIDGKKTEIYKGDTVETNTRWAPPGVVTGWRDVGVLVKATAPDFRNTAASLVPESAIKSVQPTGPRTVKYKASAGMYTVGEVLLPSVTFERAGTAASTRIVVLEKQSKAENAPNQKSTIDLTGLSDINDLFARMENLTMPERKMTADQQEAMAAEQKQAEASEAKTERNEAAKKQSAAVGDKVMLAGKEYDVVVYTTNAGKEIRGAWVKTKELATRFNDRTFQKKPLGWFVREKDFPPATGQQKSTRPTKESPRTPASTIRASITKAYGNLLIKLEAKGLVTIAQTEREAIEAAAQARADKTGGDVDQIKRSMLASVQMQRSGMVNVDPDTLIFREEDQNRTESVSMAYPDTADMPPIVLISEPNGDKTILDGHNRAAVALDRGDELPSVSLTRKQYDELQSNGYDDIEIAYATLRENNENEAADALDYQFTGAGVAERGRQAWINFPEQDYSDTEIVDVKYSANGNIEGFFDKQTGKSFLVADNLTAASAPGTLMHEVGIHMAAGGKMAELFKRAGSILKTGTQNAFIQRVKDRMARAGETSDEEAAAYIATEYETNRLNAPVTVGKWIADLTAAVRAWLFRNGIVLKAEQLTIADIAAVARANARSMARGGPEISLGDGQMFSRLRSGLTKVRGGWTKEKIRKELKGMGLGAASGKYVQRYIAEFDSAEEFADHIFYHGTGGYVSGSLRPSIVRTQAEAERGGGGGYGERYWAISVSKSKEKASGFTGQSSYGSVYPVILKKGANVISMPEIQDSVELEDIIEDLWNQGVDAVRLGDWSSKGSEEELAILNPAAVFTYQKPDTFPVFQKKKFEALTKQAIDDIYTGAIETANRLDEIRKLPTREEKDAELAKIQDIRFSRGGGIDHSDMGTVGENDSPSSNWDVPLASSWDDKIYKLQDKNIDTKRVIQAIKKMAGDIQDKLNVYLQEELYHGRTAKRVLEFGRGELNPALDELAAMGYSIEDLEEYMHARHAPEANVVLAARNPTREMIDTARAEAKAEIKRLKAELSVDGVSKDDAKALKAELKKAEAKLKSWTGVAAFNGTEEERNSLSGMKTEEAEAYFRSLPAEDAAKLKKVADKMDAIMAETSNMMVAYHLESQETVDGWNAMYRHYIPLHREGKDDGSMGTGQGFSIKGREVKGRTGSKRKVVNIVAHIAEAREKTIVRGEKNRIAQALVGLVTAYPNADFWKTGAPPSERVFDRATGKVKNQVNPAYKSLPNVVMAKIMDEDGKVKEVAVTFNEGDERAVRMAGALKNLDTPQIEGWLGTVAKATRYFAAVNTQFNPVFGAVNLVRDIQGAMINLGSTPLADQKLKIARDSVDALAGIYRDIRATRRGEVGSSKWSELYEQFQHDGGQTGFRNLFETTDDRSQELKDRVSPTDWAKSPLGRIMSANGKLTKQAQWMRDGFAIARDWLSDYNETMESATRLATYKAALDKGMTREQAASLAKNITVNFNRKGTMGTQAGALYAFFNAAMQGTARMGETLVTMEPGKPKTMRLSPFGKKVVYGGVLLGAIQALALAAGGFGDEEPPDFERERNLLIPTGWTGVGPDKGYIKIPMPLGLHVIPGIGRMGMEFALSGGEDPAKAAIKFGSMMADAFNPIGNAGLSMQTVAPTVLDPLAALVENKDWTGKKIARESFNKDAPMFSQHKDSATFVAKFLAELVNYATGGNEYVGGALNWSPDQIDYLIGQVTGGVGRELSKVEQTATGAFTGDETPIYKVPLLGRFAGSASGKSGEANAFYTNADKLNRLETELKGMQKDGKAAEAAALRMERPESRMIVGFNMAERQVQKLRKQKSALIEAGASAADVRAVDERITAIMQNMNQRMLAVAGA